MNAAFQPSRRGLFRSLSQKAQGKPISLIAVRPPGAVTETSFVDVCTRCEDCVSKCPEDIIVKGDGGFPELNFSERGCTGCMQCIDACTPNALVKTDDVFPLGLLDLKETCLPKSGVACQSCKDACDDSAIRFPMTARLPIPEIDNTRCNGLWRMRRRLPDGCDCNFACDDSRERTL